MRSYVTRERLCNTKGYVTQEAMLQSDCKDFSALHDFNQINKNCSDSIFQ